MNHGRIAAALAAATALAVPATAQAAGYQDAVKADNPLAYLQLDETTGTLAVDSAGDNDGTYSGGYTLQQQAPFTDAGFAPALTSTGRVTAPVATASRTIELWVNPAKLSRGQQAGIVSHGDPATTGWAVGVGAKRKLAFVANGSAPVRTRVTLPANAWTQLTVVWGVDGKVRPYVNGTAAKPFNGVAGAAGGELVLGGNGAGAFSGSFAGRLDEVALYSQALDATDVKEHFAAAKVPVNTGAPTIPGGQDPIAVGDTLTVDPGTWTGGTITTTYQWQRCDAAGEDCEDILGATAGTYVVTAEDACHTLQVVITQTNEFGATTVITEPTGQVQGDCGGGTDPGTGTGGGTDPGTGGGTGGGTGTDPGTGTGSGTGTDTGTGTGTGTGTDTGTGAGTGTGGGTLGEGSGLTQTCLKLASRAAVKLRRVGNLRLNVKAPGCIGATTPLALKVKQRKGAAKLAKVVLKLDGKRVKVRKAGKRYAARVAATRLPVGTHRLVVKVKQRDGKTRKFKLRVRVASA